MARIVVGSWMVRYPLGGNLSWTLQWLIGFQRLGHDIYLVEKAGWPESCYDVAKRIMTDDCAYGTGVVHALLERFGLGDRWCFVDIEGRYHGLARTRVEAIFESADLFVDIGSHGDWLAEAAAARRRVWVDGEPGFTQMKLERRLAAGEAAPSYDAYYTNGANVGTERSTAPTAGKAWRPLFNPVVVDLFQVREVEPDAPFTTVMNWQSRESIEFGGALYGQKDVEFEKFIDLPSRTTVPLEISVSGKIPAERLKAAGWRLRDAHEVTVSFDSFVRHVTASRGEFSVCKHGYVATRSGWFSDRSAVYLASGRPAVVQDTGFSEHLPSGRGLFAVSSSEEAAAAIEAICSDYRTHSRSAREIAAEHLDASKVLKRLLSDVGL